MQEDKMQSTKTENDAQQGSPEHMEHQWHMDNDSNIAFRNNFITRYIVTFKGINKPYLTLPYHFHLTFLHFDHFKTKMSMVFFGPQLQPHPHPLL